MGRAPPVVGGDKKVLFISQGGGQKLGTVYKGEIFDVSLRGRIRKF